MAPHIHFPLQYISFMILLSLCVVPKPNAFTIKFVHRYSPESPYYDANLTYHEIVERQNFPTRTRKQYTTLINHAEEPNGTLMDLQTIRAPLDFFIPTVSAFLVKVSLGTFSDGPPSHKSYYLDLDTGRDIIWLQCEDCKSESGSKCYRQIVPPFPSSKSTSYSPLPCDNHHLCFPGKCVHDSCSYYADYNDGSLSEGILAHEKFVFPSSTEKHEVVQIVFGCGFRNKRISAEDKDLKTSGVFGLGWGPRSFINQIHSISERRFSHCFPPTNQAIEGLPIFLRFGSDIPPYTGLAKTALKQLNDESSYYVDLLGMSMNDDNLGIPARMFRAGSRIKGFVGCSIDTGNPKTYLLKHAYNSLALQLHVHIKRQNPDIEAVDPKFGYQLCYRSPKPFVGHNTLPTITFHFERGADLVVKPEVAFYHNSHEDSDYDYICLTMVEGKRTIIGSHTLTNQLVVYDLEAKTIHFGPRECSQNP